MTIKNFVCPRCKTRVVVHPAISRMDDVTEVCANCGTLEALEVWKEYLDESMIYGWKKIREEENLVEYKKHSTTAIYHIIVSINLTDTWDVALFIEKNPTIRNRFTFKEDAIKFAKDYMAGKVTI